MKVTTVAVAVRLGALCVALSAGCAASAPSSGKELCMKLDDPNALWPHARLVRIAIFGEGARCIGPAVTPSDATPIATRDSTPVDALALDAPVALTAIVVTLFADAAGQIAIGSACADAVMPDGSCFMMRLVKTPSLCVSDADCPTPAPTCCDYQCINTQTDVSHCGACSVSCGTLHATAACTQGACAFTCEPGYARCVAANMGCETNLAAEGLSLCNGACIRGTGCCANTDCQTPPGPAVCYVGSCVDHACSYGPVDGAVVAADRCCRAIHGTCAPDATLTCDPGFADCDGDATNGCETSTTDVSHCGTCTTSCSYTNASAVCDVDTCRLSACNAGFLSCDGSDANGCECAGSGCCGSGICQTRHSNGLGQTFEDCVPLGTYTQDQAMAACTRYTGNATQCTTSGCTGAICSTGSPTGCNCWFYSGGNTGGVRTGAASNCKCNGGTQPWN